MPLTPHSIAPVKRNAQCRTETLTLAAPDRFRRPTQDDTGRYQSWPTRPSGPGLCVAPVAGVQMSPPVTARRGQGETHHG
jgi:hypothetical protein